MTPLFKFSLLGLGAASAGGGVICISKREAIREYFRGPSNQTPAGSGEGSRPSGVHSQDTSTETSTTNTQGTDLNNRGQDSNQGETRSPVPGEDQVDGSKDPIVTEDQKVNGASETAKSPQDLQQPNAPRDQTQERRDLPSDDQHQAPTVQDLQQQQPPGAPSQDRGNLSDNQDQPQQEQHDPSRVQEQGPGDSVQVPTDQDQIQQLPPGNPGSIDQVPDKPQGQDGENVQGPKEVGGDAVDRQQKPGEVVNPEPGPDGAPGPGHDGESDPNATHQGGEPGRDRVDSAPGSELNGVPGPAPGEKTDPNVTPKGGVGAPGGTRQPVVKGPGVVGPTGDGDLSGQQRAPGGELDEHSSSNNAKGGPGAGGGGSLPKGEGSQIEQGNAGPGSGEPAPGPGALPSPTDSVNPAPTGPSPEGHTPKEPSNPAPVADTTDYQCLLSDGDYSTTNKKAIKDFLDSMGIKDKHGFQIHDESYDKGFKCAKDMDDSLLGGLKDYMEGEKTNFNKSPDSRHDNEPMV